MFLMGTHTQPIETKWEIICSTSGVRAGAAVPWGISAERAPCCLALWKTSISYRDTVVSVSCGE